MGSSFINKLNSIYYIAAGRNSTEIVPCKEKIDRYELYKYTLIPAVLITLSFAVTKRRRNMLLNLFWGRPALIYPMDTLSRSSRISYACSFGATALLVYKIVLEGSFAIEYNGHGALKSLIAIASMFIYGLVFFPLFASLTIGSVYGYTLGSLYVWMLTAVEIYKVTECQMIVKGRVLLVLNALPSLLCLLYLSVSIPLRMIRACRQGKYFGWQDDFEETNTLQEIRDSYAGHHVTKLFKKVIVKPPPETLKDRIMCFLMNLIRRVIYHRKRGFRYPARMISVMFISVIVIYINTLQFMSVLPPMFDLYLWAVRQYTDMTIGLEPADNESEDVADTRTFLLICYYVLYVTKICVIVSNALATVLALLNALHSLSSYRSNLFALYRGDHSHIPPASEYSNTSHCINSIKYAGFQVGYIIWGYMIQFFILFLLACICGVVIIWMMYDFTFWLLFLLELVGPVILTAIVFAVTQMLLAKFVFLQERGKYLALDNRNMYFIFTYFMFFYNIFLGLVSCLLRILKSMVVGIFFLGRLDNSTMPRRFEFIDPGFRAYMGYMQMEAAHTHPVVIVFSRLMLAGLREKRERDAKRRAQKETVINGGFEGHDKVKNGHGVTEGSEKMDLKIINNRFQSSEVDETSDVDDKENLIEAHRRRRLAARFSWHVIYTLLHNPDIRVMRKGYLQMLRQAKLLGVHVPISDRQADIDFDDLQERITEAKDGPSKKKNKDDEDDDSELQDVSVTKPNGSARGHDVSSGLQLIMSVERVKNFVSGSEGTSEDVLPAVSQGKEEEEVQFHGAASLSGSEAEAEHGRSDGHDYSGPALQNKDQEENSSEKTRAGTYIAAVRF